jgi:tetratricopeptide (TPR) repeat protein
LDEASDRVARALDLLLDVPTEEATITAESLYDLGSHALDLGRLEDSCRAWDRLERLTIGAARDDRLRLATLENLGWTLHLSGDDTAARSPLEAALVELEAQWPDKPRTQRVRLKLSLVLRGLGDLSRARTLAEDSLKTLQAQLPPEHADLLVGMANLGEIRASLGDFAGAEELQEAVLQGWRRALPPDHSDLLRTKQNLAVTRFALGHAVGAKELFEDVLEVRARLLAPDHPDLLRAKQNLASTRRALGDLTGAMTLLEDVLTARSRLLPADHSDTILVRQELARTLRDLGETAKAEDVEEGRWP